MTQYLDWKVGDPLVCIDGEKHGRNGELHGLTLGQFYTIRRIGVLDVGHPDDGKLVVWLREIVRPLHSIYTGEVGYFVSRFRKVQPRKTSIAVFERLLNTQNNEVEAV